MRLLMMHGNLSPSGDHLARLAELGATPVVVSDEASAIAHAPEADVVVGQRYLRQIMPYAVRLRWVQATAAGIDHLLTEEFRAHGAWLSRCPIFAETVAWHGLALAGHVMRGLSFFGERQLEGAWNPPILLPPLPQTAMVIGMGHIGQALSKKLRGLGLRVLGVYRETRPPEDSADALWGPDLWRDALGQVDWCFLAIPERPGNRHYFDERAIRALPSHAILVNLGRGMTLDLAALAQALREGHLAGAALDALDPIPGPGDPIWHTPRLIITPKVATFSRDRDRKLEAFIEDQVARVMAGEPPMHRVDYAAN